MKNLGTINNITVYITKQPITYSTAFKLFFHPKRDINADWYNWTTKDIVKTGYKGPGEYILSTSKSSANGKYYTVEMQYVDSLPEGLEPEEYATEDTYCFTPLGFKGDTLVYCSSFDADCKKLGIQLTDDDIENILDSATELKPNVQYKITRTKNNDNTYTWLWATLRLMDEDTSMRKDRWQVGKYKDDPCGDAITKLFSF